MNKKVMIPPPRTSDNVRKEYVLNSNKWSGVFIPQVPTSKFQMLKILWAIYKVWSSSRNMRFLRLGQLIDNAMVLANANSVAKPDLFVVRDEDLVRNIEKFNNSIEKMKEITK